MATRKKQFREYQDGDYMENAEIHIYISLNKKPEGNNGQTGLQKRF